jgi:hypothetical protein
MRQNVEFIQKQLCRDGGTPVGWRARRLWSMFISLCQSLLSMGRASRQNAATAAKR